MKKPVPTPGTEIEIFGEVHSLRFKALGIIDIERKTGKSFMRQAKEIFEGITIELCAALVAAGLKHEMPDVTMEAVAAEIDLEQLQYFTDCIVSAFNKAFPKPEATGKVTEMAERRASVG